VPAAGVRRHQRRRVGHHPLLLGEPVVQSIDYHAIAPELVLVGTILVVIVFDAFLPAERKWISMPVSLVGVLGALAATLSLIGDDRVTFGGMYRVDSFAVLFKVFFLVSAVVVLGMSLRYFQEGRYYQGEYYSLLLAAFLGALTMAS